MLFLLFLTEFCQPSCGRPPTPLLQDIALVIPTQPPLTAPKNQPQNHRPLRPSLLRLHLLHDLNTNLLPSLNTNLLPSLFPCILHHALLLRASQPSMFKGQGRPAWPQQQPVRGPTQVQYMPASPRGPDLHTGLLSQDFCPAPSGGYQGHSTMVELLLMEVRMHGDQSQVTMPLLQPPRVPARSPEKNLHPDPPASRHPSRWAFCSS